MEHIGVESAGGGGQGPQGTENIARLLSRYSLLKLLHVLFDICNSPGKTRQVSNSGRLSHKGGLLRGKAIPGDQTVDAPAPHAGHT